MAHALTEGGEELGLQGADAHVFAVRGLVEVVDSAAVEEARFAHGHGAAREVAGAVHGIEGNDAVLHGDVDELALPGLFPVDDGGQDAGDGVHGAAGDVGDLEIVEAGAAGLAACRPGDARAGQVVDVVARLHGKGAGLAVARDRAVDEAGIDLAQLLIADAQLGHDAGPELFHDDVIVHDQLFDGLDRRGFFQVEEHGLFVPPQPGLGAGHLRALDNRRPVDDQVVFVAPAHLEHFGAHVRQGHRGIGARQERCEIQDLVSVKCAFHSCLSFFLFTLSKYISLTGTSHSLRAARSAPPACGCGRA